MNHFEIIGIFLAPILGTTILYTYKNLNFKIFIIYYINIITLSNILTCLIVYIFKGHYNLYFTTSFFIKYGLLNIFNSIMIALFIIILKNKIEVEIYVKK